MKISEVMTMDPAVCTPEDTLAQAARLMAEADCGALPVVERPGSLRLVGVITDRDIVCRAVAKGGREPSAVTVREVMSSPALTMREDEDIGDCCRLMEDNQIRRVPIVDDERACVGIVSQADVARHASRFTVSRVLREVSRPAREPAVVDGGF